MVEYLNPGEIWEVQAPDGELLLFLIAERVAPDGPVTLEFVQTIPLTDYMHPFLHRGGDGCITVQTHPETPASPPFYTAHVWLEGPLLVEALARCVGSITPAAVDAVLNARAALRTKTCVPIAALREALFAQFDSVFKTAWEKLCEAHPSSC